MTARRYCRPGSLRWILLGTALLVSLDVAIAALTITEKTTPSLGTLLSGASGRNFKLNTDQTVSGSDAADYLCCANSGELTVKKTGGSQSATIVADNFSQTGGVTIVSVPCKYGSGSVGDCSGSGISVTVGGTVALMVGVEINTTQVHSGGNTATATYDITINLL